MFGAKKGEKSERCLGSPGLSEEKLINVIDLCLVIIMLNNSFGHLYAIRMNIHDYDVILLFKFCFYYMLSYDMTIVVIFGSIVCHGHHHGFYVTLCCIARIFVL